MARGTSVRIYTKSHCPYCVRAKRFLDEKKIPYEDISIENDPEGAEKLFAQTGFRTVPQIFIGERCIGGCDDMLALDRDGKLNSLLFPNAGA